MTILLADEPTVLEFGVGISTAICGRFLMGLGSRVVQLETTGGSLLRSAPPLVVDEDGHGTSALFGYLSAGKANVAVDDSTAAGRSVLEGLLRGADIVLVDDISREFADSAALVEKAAEANPRLIIARISMFGDRGPYARFNGGEFQALALGGLMHMIGDREDEPLRLGGYQAQYTAGLSLLVGVSALLYQRDRDGIGGEVRTSVLESVAYVEWKSAAQYQSDGSQISRGSSAGPFILTCADGFSAFYYGARNWQRVKDLFGDPRLEAEVFQTQEGRDANRTELAAILSECTLHMSKVDVYLAAQELGMPVGYGATMLDLLESRQYVFREFLEKIVSDVGEPLGVVPRVPWTVNGRRPDIGTRIPVGSTTHGAIEQ